MIVDSELPVAPVVGTVAYNTDQQSSRRRRWPFSGIALFGLFLAVVVLLQIASGAYHGEFSAYPDEPAHYVTSLMLRDYLVHFHFESPMRFAEEYYHHYPKVAFGHWPPLFYVLQSAWMMLFSASRVSVRLEIAFTSALLAYSVYSEARRWFDGRSGVLAGLLTAMLPLVQDYSDQEMAEALLTLLCFWSTVYFARYLKTVRLRDALLFGAFFSAAVLTKGSGWLLALIPPVALVLTRRLDLLKRASFWAPVALVAIVCVPWQLLTLGMAEKGWDGGTKPSLEYTVSALFQFLGLFPKILGPIFVLFLLAGLYATLVRRRISAAAASFFGLLLSVWIFHSIVPAGVEERKLVLAVPAMILFVFAGAKWFANLIPVRSSVHRFRYWMVATVGAVAFLVTTFAIPRIPHYGFIEAAGYLSTHENSRDATVLVSSESGGEGLLISEVAMKNPVPRMVIIRATKALASVEWDGRNYQPRFSSVNEVRQFLVDNHIQYVVLDTFTPQVRFPHNALLRQALQQRTACPLIARFEGDREAPGQVQIFRLPN